MKSICSKIKDTRYLIKSENGEEFEVVYPSSQIYHLEDEIRHFFAELHLPNSEMIAQEFCESGQEDYRKFLESIGARLDKEFWKTYRQDYGMGNEPCQLGGGNAFIMSVDKDNDIVVLMNKRSLEAPENFHRYSPVGGGYRNWRYTDSEGKTWCSCESSYLTAMRECKEESGKALNCKSMVFFSRENATSYPNGQVVCHAESIYYLCWTDFDNLRGFLGESYEGKTCIIKLRDIASGEYPIFSACKHSVERLVKQYL